jgi:thiamine pyrophosphokinase
VIAANGVLIEPMRVSSLIQPDDLVIAADGGAAHLVASGVWPQVVVGDMDSLTGDLAAELAEGGAKFIEYPEDKAQTDLELALRFALSQNPDEVLLVGLTGGRLDQTLSNLLVLTKPEWEAARLIIGNGQDTAYLMRDQDEIVLNSSQGDIVSLIPLSGVVSGVKTEGLQWSLENASLEFGTTLGISNKMISQRARVSMMAGTMLLVHREMHDL